MVFLLKNMTTTTKGNRYLKAQHYIILTNVVDKSTQIAFCNYTTN